MYKRQGVFRGSFFANAMCQILDVLFRFSRVRRTGKQMLEKKERKSKALKLVRTVKRDNLS